MMEEDDSAGFEALTTNTPEEPTLIEGLPGHGLVASIAVDQITTQLEMEQMGNIYSRKFPPVVTFEDGLVHDLVRVYASSDPAVMTLQSDLALPPQAFEPLSECVLEDLADTFNRAIFIAGAPAESEERLGEVHGVATTEDLRAELTDAGVPLAEEHGVVGDITGALMRECYHANVPAILLIVRAHPRFPDPSAAIAVIEAALEPLVEFEIDTTELEEHAEEIQQQLRHIAQQYEQRAREQQAVDPRQMGMYQ